MCSIIVCKVPNSARFGIERRSRAEIRIYDMNVTVGVSLLLKEETGYGYGY